MSHKMYKSPKKSSNKSDQQSPSQLNAIIAWKSAFKFQMLKVIVWMVILLGQSTSGNSVFLESCSSNNINQVFCHNDQLYVIQDSVLYYGNSCGQMMTNETIRITKKFKTAVQMKTAFIDDKNSIYLFSNSFVLTSSLDNRNVVDLANISEVMLDYRGTVKYTVFEPTLKQVYVVDQDNKMHSFNSKIFSHTGSIKWGKVHSRYVYLDLSSYPFDYFFFSGKDLYTKLKGRNQYSYIRNFGECLKDWKVNDIPDFEHCFNSYFISSRAIPFKVLVCTEIQYILFMIFILLMLLILLFCCLSCCYNYVSNKENGGESYYVKDNEDRFLKKLFKKYPKDKFNQFVKLYQENKINPVHLDPKSQTKPAIYDVEVAKNGFLTENKLTSDFTPPMEIQYVKSGAPIEIRPKQDLYQVDGDKLRKSKKDKNEPRQLQPHEINYATIIPVNQNNNNLVFMDNNSNFERASLILEDYAENRPDIDLKEPGIDNPRFLYDLKPIKYQVYEMNRSRSQEHIVKVNKTTKKELASYQTSTPNFNASEPFDFTSSRVEQEVKEERIQQKTQQRKSEYSIKNIIPNLKSLFSFDLTKDKDPMTKF